MNILIEKKLSVTTIIISRPEVRNAIDRQTALELVTAFKEFDENSTFDGTKKFEGGSGCHGKFL